MSIVPVPPPEVEEFLKDPRAQDMRLQVGSQIGERRMLMPDRPPIEGECPFVLFDASLSESSPATVKWVNSPMKWSLGGEGFGFITEKPLIKESRRRPKKLRDAWHYNGWLVASPRFAEIVQRYEPQICLTREIDWVFSDGKKLEGYVFLDVCRLIYAYDYWRSEVLVEGGTKDRYVTGVGARRALKSSIDPALHAFREKYIREDHFFSRELAQALMGAGIREVGFRDLATMRLIEFGGAG